MASVLLGSSDAALLAVFMRQCGWPSPFPASPGTQRRQASVRAVVPYFNALVVGRFGISMAHGTMQRVQRSIGSQSVFGKLQLLTPNRRPLHAPPRRAFWL